MGRWKIKGSPVAILVDFSSLIPRKDEILTKLWEDYHVDSLSGQWDYIEPVLFGYAAGVVISSYVKSFCTTTEKVVAHCHEWMAAATGLYLRKYSPTWPPSSRATPPSWAAASPATACPSTTT